MNYACPYRLLIIIHLNILSKCMFYVDKYVETNLDTTKIKIKIVKIVCNRFQA